MIGWAEAKYRQRDGYAANPIRVPMNSMKKSLASHLTSLHGLSETK